MYDMLSGNRDVKDIFGKGGFKNMALTASAIIHGMKEPVRRHRRKFKTIIFELENLFGYKR